MTYIMIACPSRKEFGYNVILKGQKGGTNGQEKSIVKNRWLETKETISIVYHHH